MITKARAFSILAALLVSANAGAHGGGHSAHPADPSPSPQPYAGQQAREIKSLSDEEIRQYLSGAGMGFAKSAELNRYPGPMHALELADRLELTVSQRRDIEVLMKTHKAEARGLGAAVIERERALEKLFASGNASEAELAAAVKAAAAAQGEYRLSHLETHRKMRPLLTDEQVTRYIQLRGYDSATAKAGKHRH